MAEFTIETVEFGRFQHEGHTFDAMVVTEEYETLYFWKSLATPGMYFTVIPTPLKFHWKPEVPLTTDDDIEI